MVGLDFVPEVGAVLRRGTKLVARRELISIRHPNDGEWALDYLRVRFGMGFLGVAGIAIIALYVYAQGRRSRAKEAGEAGAAPGPIPAASEVAETSNPTLSTSTDGE